MTGVVVVLVLVVGTVDSEVRETLSEEVAFRLKSKCHKVTSSVQIPRKRTMAGGGERDRNQVSHTTASFLPSSFSAEGLAF